MQIADLSQRLDTIDGERRALLAELESVDPGSLFVRPSADTWSICEIVEHLVLAERDVFGFSDARARSHTKARTIRDRFAYALVMLILRSRVRVQTPAKTMDPKGEMSLSDLRDMWDDNHRRVREFLAELQPEHLRRPVFTHPIAGPLTPGAAIAMLHVHLQRHAGQIRRRLASDAA